METATGGAAASPKNRVVGRVIVGVLTGLVVLIAGVGVLLSRPPTWTARSTLLVVPSDTKSAAATGYYETIGQGQVIATFAEILRGTDLQQQVAVRAGIPAKDAPTASVEVVPGTSLIRVTVSDKSEAIAANMASALAGSASGYIASLDQPFRISSFRSVGVSESSSLQTNTFLVAMALLALVFGFAAAQVYGHLRRVRADGQGSAGAAAVPPGDVPAPPVPQGARQGRPLRPDLG